MSRLRLFVTPRSEEELTPSSESSREKAYFINPGAVGQPRDNNPNAAYLSYDLEERVIELFRVPYDIATAQRKIREADLDV